jgi:hypothetical protein
MRRVCGSLTQKYKGGGLKKRFEIFNGLFEMGGRVKYSWMGYNP